VEDELDELREQYSDIPSEEDFEESLANPETVKRLSAISTSTSIANAVSRPTLITGTLLGLYVVLVKLPAVVIDTNILFLSSIFDPILLILVFGFGVGWSIIGFSHLLGAWSFYRLRKLQNSPTGRPIKHGLRGLFVFVNGLFIISFGVLFVWIFISL